MAKPLNFTYDRILCKSFLAHGYFFLRHSSGVGGAKCILFLAEGSLEVKLPTICKDGKAEVGRLREEKSRSEEIRERVGSKKMQVRKKRKVAIHYVFPMIRGSGGSEVTSLKRSQLARREMKNCTELWREAHFQVKSVKNRHRRSQTTFGS